MVVELPSGRISTIRIDVLRPNYLSKELSDSYEYEPMNFCERFGCISLDNGKYSILKRSGEKDSNTKMSSMVVPIH